VYPADIKLNKIDEVYVCRL